VISHKFDDAILQFGQLRLPVLYALTISSMYKPRVNVVEGATPDTFVSLYDLLIKPISELTKHEKLFLLQIYNVAVKLDCLTNEDRERYTIAEDSINTLCEYPRTEEETKILLGKFGIDADNKESMESEEAREVLEAGYDEAEIIMYLKKMETHYFGTPQNKSDVLELFENIFKLCDYNHYYEESEDAVDIRKVHWTNFNGVQLLKLFMPNTQISAAHLISRIMTQDGQTLDVLARDRAADHVLQLTCMQLLTLINNATNEQRMNILQNITGSLSLPPLLNLVIDNGEMKAPGISYATCSSTMTINLKFLSHKLGKIHAEVKSHDKRQILKLFTDYLAEYFLNDLSNVMSMA
jgi:hypothetical protein